MLYLRSKRCKIAGFHDFGLPTSSFFTAKVLYSSSDFFLSYFEIMLSSHLSPFPQKTECICGTFFFSNSLVKLNMCFQGVNKSWLIGQKFYVRHSSTKETAPNQPIVIAPHYCTHRHVIFKTDILFIWAFLNVILISQTT